MIEGEGRDEHFKWVSNCGVERNFIAAAVSPVVFNALSDDGKTLGYGHQLTVPFQPTNLKVHSSKLFHPHPHLGDCLIRTHLLQDWIASGRLKIHDDGTLTWIF